MYKQNPIKLFCRQMTTTVVAAATPALDNVFKEETTFFLQIY